MTGCRSTIGSVVGSLALASVAACGTAATVGRSSTGSGPATNTPVGGTRSTTEVLTPAGPHGQGIGDPYYPDDGNHGYDVLRYDVIVTYRPSPASIVATTIVTARATSRLSRFDLDLRGFTVDSVAVGGRSARFERTFAYELVTTPAAPVARGATFRTTVRYHGRLEPIRGGPVVGGWHPATTPGSGFIAGEPHSCTAWYPCNDHPSDKARFTLTATVPRPFSVVSNGVELPVRQPLTGMQTFRWSLDAPTATYLTMMYIDKLTFERSTLPGGSALRGVGVVSAFGPRPGRAVRREAKLPKILAFLASKFGPYPAPAAGGVFVDASFGFSLETYTRPTFTKNVDVTTIVHENAHQWWGDHVSIERWRDICLNECMASYAQWLWDEHNGADLDKRYRSQVKDFRSVFDRPLYGMGPGHEFDFEGVYFKGQWFLHALRRKLGSDAFFGALQQVQRDYADRNLSMIGLRDALEKDTGVDLTSFWNEWVLHTGIPSDANLYPGSLGP
jgi:aminopeptidase N